MMGFRVHFIYLGLFLLLSCLNLSHAQVNQTQQNSESVQNPNAQNGGPAANQATQIAPAPIQIPASVPTPAPIPSAAPVQVSAPVPTPVAAPVAAPAFPSTLPAVTPFPAIPTTPIGAGATTPTSEKPVDVNSLLNNQNINATGKYSEYQSICRSREFDKFEYKSQEDYQQELTRLNEQVEKLLKQSDLPKSDEIFKLMAELLTVNDLKNVKKVFDHFKSKLNSKSDLEILNGLFEHSKKSYTQARNLFLSALQEQPKNKTLLLILAQNYLKEENYFEASTIYEDLNTMSNQDYQAELCETLVYNSLNADAEKVCMAAARKFRKNPFPLIYAGVSTRELLNNKKAMAYFRLSLKVKPTEMAHVCVAEIHLMNKDTASAINSFKEALTVSPRSPRAYLGLAAAQMQNRLYEDALESYRAACKINPIYEIEIRKAYKTLASENNSIAEKYISVAQSCSRL